MSNFAKRNKFKSLTKKPQFYEPSKKITNTVPFKQKGTVYFPRTNQGMVKTVLVNS